jgi:hypothetical protein
LSYSVKKIVEGDKFNIWTFTILEGISKGLAIDSIYTLKERCCMVEELYGILDTLPVLHRGLDFFSNKKFVYISFFNIFL